MSKKPFEMIEYGAVAETTIDLNEVGQVNKFGNLSRGNGEFDLKGSTIKIGVFTDATRPAAGTAGRIIYNSNTLQIEVDDGTAWMPFTSGWTIVKSADESIGTGSAGSGTPTDGDIYQNDDEILFPVYANEEWFFMWMPIQIAETGPSGTIQWKFTVPTGTAMVAFEPDGALEGLVDMTAMVADGTGTVIGAAFYVGKIDVGGTSGTIQLQWLKRGNYATRPVTMKKGTTFMAFRTN